MKFLRKNIFKLSVVVVLIYLVLISVSVLHIGKKIRFNYELESFFPQGDPSLEYYLNHIHRFESDHDVVLMAFTSPNGLFNKEFLTGLEDFRKELDTNTYINQVISPLQMGRLKKGPLAPVKLPFFHFRDESKYEADSLRLSNTNHFIKNFLSLSSASCCLIAKVKPGIGIKTSARLVEEINRIAKKHVPGQLRMAGRVRAQTYIIHKMQYEFVLLTAITALMLVVFLFYSFRSFFGVLLPVMVVMTGMVLTLSLILFCTGSLNLLSVMLPTVIFVVGVSDSIHVLNAYYGYMEQGFTSREAVFETISEIGAAVFLTAITSAIGFFTLFTIQIQPVAEFGIYAGAGILITFLVSFTLLIAALILLKPGKSKRPSYLAEANWILRLFDFVNAKKKWVLAG
ncbi:MAG: MMPL family transporter, partial [Flavobacteriales bacterium]